MKKLLAISSLALAALAPLSAQAVGTLYMSPAKQDVAVNDVVSVDVFISGLGNEIVSAFDLNVLFSSTILSAGGSVDFNEPILGGADSAWDATFDPGDRGVVAYSLLTDNEVAALQGDDPLKLFTMTFSALTDGVTKLNFGPSLDFERNVVGRDAGSLRLSYEGACVAVGTAKGGCDVPAIPEPSTYALMLLGLGIVGVAARSKKRA